MRRRPGSSRADRLSSPCGPHQTALRLHSNCTRVGLKRQLPTKAASPCAAVLPLDPTSAQGRLLRVGPRCRCTPSGPPRRTSARDVPPDSPGASLGPGPSRRSALAGIGAGAVFDPIPDRASFSISGVSSSTRPVRPRGQATARGQRRPGCGRSAARQVTASGSEVRCGCVFLGTPISPSWRT